MGVKTVQHARNLATEDDDGRDFSAAVWHDCQIDDIKNGYITGVIHEYDFTELPKTPATTEGNFGLFSQFSSTGGFINAHTGQGGGWVFGSDGDNEGASIRTRATPFKLSRASQKLWFEVVLTPSTADDTKNGMFVGLMEDAVLTATVPIAADGTLADQNFVGFHRLEGDGDQIDTVYKANGVTQVTVQADALNTALAAATRVKLGLVYEQGLGLRSGTRYTLTFFQNGRPLGTTKTIPSTDGDDFPNDVGLGLVFAVLNATGTSPGDWTLDKWRCVQLLA